MGVRMLRGSIAAAAVFLVVLGATACGGVVGNSNGKQITMGFLVKTLGNPYFDAMQQAAQSEAKKDGVNLIFQAAKYDGDNATQVTQVQNLTTRHVDVIAVVPNLSAGIVPSLNAAKQAGIKIMSVDTATDPTSAAQTFIATDNYKAGVLNGEWAKKAMAGKAPVVTLLEGTPGSEVNTDRLNGFLTGFGMSKSQAAADLITNGDQGTAQTAMENALAKAPNTNLAWGMNENAALGAVAAIQEHGLTGKVQVLSMDGGCRGIAAVQQGQLSTEVMQYPAKMAKIAVDDAVAWVKNGKKPPARIDTGEDLVTMHGQAGVPFKPVSFGAANCWGSK